MKKILKPLDPGDNTRVDVIGDLDQGVTLYIRAPHFTKRVKFRRETAISLALAVLKTAGVPIDEAINRMSQPMKGD